MYCYVKYCFEPPYRVTHVLPDLGWVVLDLGCSTGRWAYCSCGAPQARKWSIQNASQPNPVIEEMGRPVH